MNMDNAWDGLRWRTDAVLGQPPACLPHQPAVQKALRETRPECKRFDGTGTRSASIWTKRWCGLRRGLPRNTVRRDGAIIRPPRQGLAWRRIQRLESLNRVNTASLATTHWTSRSPAADSKRPLQPQQSFGKPCKRSVDFFGCGSLGHYRQPALAGQEPATGWHAGMRRLGAGEQGRAGQRTACPARYINARTGRSESRWAAAHRAEAAKWIALDSPIRQ